MRDDGGADRTPRGMKDRGLLALLLLSPGQRRTRQWLQDRLWSDRTAEQAAHSCRQSLSAVRRALGPEAGRLRTDRATVWLAPPVAVTVDGPGEALADLDIRDPEFADWLRETRQALEEEPAAVAAPRPPPRADDRALILLRDTGRATTDRAAFLCSILRTRIEEEMASLGDVAVTRSAGAAADEDARACSTVEIESLEDDGRWFAMLRIYGPPSRRVLWTGRLALPLDVAALPTRPEVIRLVNQAVGVLSDQVASQRGLTPFAAIHKAVRRIYDFEAGGLAAADDLLRQVEDRDETGLARAWRAFAGLTAALEFRDGSPELGRRVLALAEAALAREAPHPTSLALVSQVQIKLGGDIDRALLLAQRAVAANDANPFALDALAVAVTQAGDPEGGYRAALQGRRVAEGLAIAFALDMQCCLSALGCGRIEDALAHALTSHRLMPCYRPPLRYLVALNLLTGRREEADRYARKLQRLEADFTPALLLRPEYPVHTLRDLGHVEGLRAGLG